jgi:hypothetical protein
MVQKTTRDGFSSKSFHSKCDGIDKTLTIIKTSNKYVFGGYTNASWSSNYDEYKSDNNAFIFSLINHINKPIKIKCTNPTNSIFNCANGGPTFGGGDDFYICDYSNINLSSYSNLSHSYRHPTYSYGSNEARSFLAGSQYFQTAKIEIFLVY